DGAEWKLRRRRVSPYDDSGGGKQPERAQLLVGIQLASVCRGGRPAATGRQSQGPRKMNTRIRSYTAVIAVFALGGTGLTGCASLSQTERGAGVGAAGGAAVGAIVGRQIGSTARGAVIGAAVGGAAGALIGRQMDQQAEELAESIPGATVQRVGEGIVVTFESGLLFPFDSDQLLPAGRENLNNLAISRSEEHTSE